MIFRWFQIKNIFLFMKNMQGWNVILIFENKTKFGSSPKS